MPISLVITAFVKQKNEEKGREEVIQDSRWMICHHQQHSATARRSVKILAA
jgi:hypothetical protein